MPRLPPTLFWQARRLISPLAPLILPVCRDLETTSNELRWIRDHVKSHPSPIPSKLRIWQLVDKRSNGTPLQYVLGTQPFGSLEILCRKGVLIPRHCTESYTLYLSTLISSSSPSPIKVLDLCTGTGCIPLLLTFLLPSATATAIDTSPISISLAKQNFLHNFSSLPPSSNMTFTQNDIFSPLSLPSSPDILTANPPYISSSLFQSTQTTRSVRHFEPKLALVPGDHLKQKAIEYNCRLEDVFYARILEIAREIAAKRVLLEVAGWEQAVRVVEMIEGKEYGTVGIWKDEVYGATHIVEETQIGRRKIKVIGEGEARAVYLSRI
ncbi:S-adenosyl-L-methionine-dependent methyltransferase [Podospora fimiseda]|uniref:peptide chain release factor N(5)-glutamine methyltransferase n=1 Tax=Podospora fimiseda TaxID=252190 RepID=A0AAN7BPE7_9PEZI|nr:S-adenosyl-L-methionine-dependent methyltransferase [Podospora fimiseda]